MHRENIKGFNVFSELTKLLSKEYNCAPEDFLRPERENVLTVSKLNRGRRRYSKTKYFFHMCTLGKNAVITADERLHPFLSEFMRDRPGYWLFEIENLHPLEKELNKHGYTLSDSFHMFLSRERVDTEKLKEKAFLSLFPDDVTVTAKYLLKELFGENGRYSEHESVSWDTIVESVDKKYGKTEDPLQFKWFFEYEILDFYGHPLMKNAILKEFTPERPDRILVCAYIGDELVAAAGCSEDARDWMQIGIDVDERYRAKGIGTLLVNMLKNEIEDRFSIPFYGTSIANYHSWNLALNCGFRPAWIEIGAKRI